MGLGTIIKNAFAGQAGGFVDKIGSVVDDLTLSKEEKEGFKIKILEIDNARETKLAEIAVQSTEQYLKDTQSARDANVKIQESTNASKLAKNVAYILDITFVAGFLIMFALIMYKQVPEDNKEIFYMAFGLLGGYVAQVVNFHRGTTASSAKKQSQIEKMINKES